MMRDRAKKIEMVLLMWKASLKGPLLINGSSERVRIPKDYHIAFDDNIRDDENEHKRVLEIYNVTDESNRFNLPISLDNYESLKKLLKLNFPYDDYQILFRDISGII